MLRKEIKMACTSANLEFLLSDTELEKVNELCIALTPLKLAIENPFFEQIGFLAYLKRV